MKKTAPFLFLAAGISASALAASTFDASTNTLTVDQVQVGQTLYNNVVLRLNNASVVSIGSSASVASTVSATCSLSNFTTAKFNAIQVGMTLDQVNSTIGCKNDSSAVRSSSFVDYSWSFVSDTYKTYQIQVFFDANGSKVLADTSGSAKKLSIGF